MPKIHLVDENFKGEKFYVDDYTDFDEIKAAYARRIEQELENLSFYFKEQQIEDHVQVSSLNLKERDVINVVDSTKIEMVVINEDGKQEPFNITVNQTMGHLKMLYVLKTNAEANKLLFWKGAYKEIKDYYTPKSLKMSEKGTVHVRKIK